ncbi:hypothetical protein [Candidatus Chlamydia corallus]|uniref:hypothetical protein n=1 Tax=Candidatus Chlamydia corallus TaxID=2038470 RepID=UPI001EFCB680|nr:hypothetical protein [Candidatus Chlamydia corallus]
MVRVNPYEGYGGRNPSPEDGKHSTPGVQSSHLHRRGGIRRKHKGSLLGVSPGSKEGRASLEKKVMGVSESHFEQSKQTGSHSKKGGGIIRRFFQWIRTFGGRGEKKSSPATFFPPHPSYIRLRTYKRSQKCRDAGRTVSPEAETTFIEQPKGILKKSKGEKTSKHVHWKESQSEEEGAGGSST